MFASIPERLADAELKKQEDEIEPNRK